MPNKATFLLIRNGGPLVSKTLSKRVIEGHGRALPRLAPPARLGLPRRRRRRLGRDMWLVQPQPQIARRLRRRVEASIQARGGEGSLGRSDLEDLRARQSGLVVWGRRRGGRGGAAYVRLSARVGRRDCEGWRPRWRWLRGRPTSTRRPTRSPPARWRAPARCWLSRWA